LTGRARAFLDKRGMNREGFIPSRSIIAANATAMAMAKFARILCSYLLEASQQTTAKGLMRIKEPAGLLEATTDAAA
jgi:hypothetical protein